MAMNNTSGKGVQVICRNCGSPANSNEFKMDLDLKMMVCLACFNRKKAASATASGKPKVENRPTTLPNGMPNFKSRKEEPQPEVIRPATTPSGMPSFKSRPKPKEEPVEVYEDEEVEIRQAPVQAQIQKKMSAQDFLDSSYDLDRPETKAAKPAKAQVQTDEIRPMKLPSKAQPQPVQAEAPKVKQKPVGWDEDDERLEKMYQKKVQSGGTAAPKTGKGTMKCQKCGYPVKVDFDAKRPMHCPYCGQKLF